jgi:hypothetical protein
VLASGTFVELDIGMPEQAASRPAMPKVTRSLNMMGTPDRRFRSSGFGSAASGRLEM